MKGEGDKGEGDEGGGGGGMKRGIFAQLTRGIVWPQLLRIICTPPPLPPTTSIARNFCKSTFSHRSGGGFSTDSRVERLADRTPLENDESQVSTSLYYVYIIIKTLVF